MIRQIIKIDEEKCDGCGECIPSCHEGALRIIDGKCRLVSDLFCDGLGACVGECTKGALQVVTAEAGEYDEISVIQSMLSKPPSVMKAHLAHLLDHGANEYFNQAVEYMKSIGISVNVQSENTDANKKTQGCPGSTMKELKQFVPITKKSESESMLGHWPIQLHLVSPFSPFLKGKHLIIMSTCSPVAYSNIQNEYIAGNAVVLACPKLDYTEPYPKKLEEIFKNANISKATVLRMEVPCCSGLSMIATKGAMMANIPGLEIHEHIISTDGRKISEKVIYKN